VTKSRGIGRGGPRTPGPGKALGRPKGPPTARIGLTIPAELRAGYARLAPDLRAKCIADLCAVIERSVTDGKPKNRHAP